MSSAAAPVAVDGSRPKDISRVSGLRSLDVLAPLAVAVLALGVALVIIAPYPVGIFHDDGVYLILARSLANGDGYRYLHLPGAPVATHYPPAYPLLLAVLWWVGSATPSNLTVLLLANAVLLAVVTWVFARYVHRGLGWTPVAAAALTIVATLSLPLLQLASVLLSEIFFLALLFPALAACESAVARERRRARLFALGAIIGGLALVRMHGLVLAIVVLGMLALRRDWRRAGYAAAGAGIILLPWQLWVALNAAALPAALRGSYGSYIGWFIDGIGTAGVSLLGRTVTRNVTEVAGLLADRFAPWPPGPWRVLLLLVVLLCAIIGALRLRRRAPVAVAFLAAYLAVTLVWPYAPWRFVWGIWPLLVLVIAEGAMRIVVWRPARGPQLVRLLPAAAALIIAAGTARAEFTAYRTRAWSTPIRDATRGIAPEMRWIMHNARPHETVVADAEPLVYLFTDHRAVPPVAFTASEYIRPRNVGVDTIALTELVRFSGARYVVTMVPTTVLAARMLATPGRGRGFMLRQADSLSGGAVFEVVRQ